MPRAPGRAQLVTRQSQFAVNQWIRRTTVTTKRVIGYIMAVLLLGGLICNFFGKPMDSKHWMSDEQLARERSLQHEDRIPADLKTAARGNFGLGGVLAWLAVGIPFCIGLYIALQKAAALF